MADLEAALDDAGLTNPQVREFVKEYAELTGAERIEVVNASDDRRLLDEAVAAGELEKAGEGRYYSRSYHKDTARSEERTIVATSDEKDRGVYNNWRHSSEMKPKLHDLMRGASAGKTMYVVPYLMAPAGNALAPWAAGVEITDTRTVVLHMIRMARVGVQFVNDLEDPGHFVRAVHVSGDLENLGQGTDGDKRYFVTVADERTILHFGSSYGGNALLGKIAHGLRQGAYDGWASKKFLAEQYMLIGIHDKETGKDYHVCGGFPSASGKTNLAMMAAPDALGDRYHVSFYGDDIAWLWVEEESGQLYGMNPEYGVFGVAKDTNETTNPNALASVGKDTGPRPATGRTSTSWAPGAPPRRPPLPWVPWASYAAIQMAMLPFIGYNAGDYWSHWIDVAKDDDESEESADLYVNSFAATRTAASCGPASARTRVCSSGSSSASRARQPRSRRRSGTCRHRARSTSTASTSPTSSSPRPSPSTPTSGRPSCRRSRSGSRSSATTSRPSWTELDTLKARLDA